MKSISIERSCVSVVIIAAISISALDSALSAADESPERSEKSGSSELYKALTDPDVAKRRAAFRDTVTQQRQLWNAIFQVLNERADLLERSKRVEAFAPADEATRLAGNLIAARNATNILIGTCVPLIAVREKGYRPKRIVRDVRLLRTDYSYFPMAVCLSAVGLQAVDKLLERMHWLDPGSTDFQLCAVTLEAILGSHLALAAVRDHYERAKKNPDPTVPEFDKQHLDAATNMIEIGHRKWKATMAKDYRDE